MFLKKIKNVNLEDIEKVGGKGASLGELTQLGARVPKGFVILSSLFDKYVSEASAGQELKKLLKDLDIRDYDKLEKTSIKIRTIIQDIKIEEEINEILKYFKKQNLKKVAVRSSATVEDSPATSWAGELETYLNVDKINLIDSMKKCWSSLYTQRAIVYRNEQRLNHKKISVAVVVQEMIDSDVSGICFTVHPVLKDKKLMIIEAGFGLGEAIVSGAITPDKYVVNKNERLIEDVYIATQKKGVSYSEKGGVKWKKIKKNLQTKQKLKGRIIIDLAEICLRIEEHYRKPQDIEWAYKEGLLYIFQSRPITTL